MQRLSMACAAFIFAVFAAADNGHAGIIIEAPSIVAMPGSSGSFDVTIYNDNAMGGVSRITSQGFRWDCRCPGRPAYISRLWIS